MESTTDPMITEEYKISSSEFARNLKETVEDIAENPSIVWTEQTSPTDNVRVCTTLDLETKQHIIKMEGYVDADALSVGDLFINASGMKDWDFLCNDQNIVDTYDHHTQVVFAEYNVSFPGPQRYFVFFRHWTESHDGQRFYLCFQSVDHKKAPNRPDTIRAQMYPSAIIATNLPHENRCKVTMILHFDLFIPKELISSMNMMSAGMVSRFIPSIREHFRNNGSNMQDQYLYRMELAAYRGMGEVLSTERDKDWSKGTGKAIEVWTREMDKEQYICGTGGIIIEMPPQDVFEALMSVPPGYLDPLTVSSDDLEKVGDLEVWYVQWKAMLVSHELTTMDTAILRSSRALPNNIYAIVTRSVVHNKVPVYPDKVRAEILPSGFFIHPLKDGRASYISCVVQFNIRPYAEHKSTLEVRDIEQMFMVRVVSMVSSVKNLVVREKKRKYGDLPPSPNPSPEPSLPEHVRLISSLCTSLVNQYEEKERLSKRLRSLTTSSSSNGSNGSNGSSVTTVVTTAAASSAENLNDVLMTNSGEDLNTINNNTIITNSSNNNSSSIEDNNNNINNSTSVLVRSDSESGLTSLTELPSINSLIIPFGSKGSSGSNNNNSGSSVVTTKHKDPEMRVTTTYNLTNLNSRQLSLDTLSSELFLQITSYLDYTSLVALSQVNKRLKLLAADESLWKNMCNDIYPVGQTQNMEGRPLYYNWKNTFRSVTVLENNWKNGKFSKKRLNEGHQKTVKCLELVGKDHVITGGSDKMVKLWNTVSGECVRVFESGTPNSGGVLALSVNGDHVTAGYRSGAIRSWNHQTGESLWEKQFTFYSNGFCFYDVMSQIVSWDESITIWNADSGQLIRTLDDHSKKINCVKLVGSRLVSGASDKLVKLWDLETGKVLQTFQGHTAGITDVDMESTNTSLLVSGSNDRLVKLWDTRSGQAVSVLKGHVAAVRVVQMNGSKVVSGSADNSMGVWELHGTMLHKIVEDNPVAVLRCNSKKIVSGNSEGSIAVWDYSVGM